MGNTNTANDSLAFNSVLDEHLLVRGTNNLYVAGIFVIKSMMHYV